ncbi:hypothetical protein HDV00_001151 [Rhizophlyctis rosea]|nr:hypothetical protein HDV00_001151 [Rhizophlyctis rosea]
MAAPCGCIFTFYSNSPKTLPGTAPGETLCPTHSSDPSYYEFLLRTPNWRRHLSNFQMTPFEYESRTYLSLEHAYQTKKAAVMARGVDALVSDEEFNRFQYLTPAKVKSAGGKLPGSIANWDRVRRAIMVDLCQIKYAQEGTERDVLLATGTAVLRHILPERELDDVGRLGASLMTIRDAAREET